MRILTLSQWYTPEPDPRIHPLARSLAERGHQVTSITGFPNYPNGDVYPGYRMKWRQWEERNGVRILRLPLFPDHSRSPLKRVLNYSSFAMSAATLGAILCGPADIMWVYHPPLTMGAPAWTISKLRNVPFVYEVQDMWPETLSATGMVENTNALKYVGAAAKQIYRCAAAITVISEGFKRNLIAKGVPAEKIHVMPNWADDDTYVPTTPDPLIAREFGFEGRFNVVFGGNMGPAQAMHSLLSSAALLKNHKAVRFVLIGDGMDVPDLQRRVELESLTNVCFIGRQVPAKMPHFFALADVLLVHLRRDPLFSITVPSKTISYLACAKPILAAVEGDTADLVRDAGAGLSCPPEDPQRLVQTILEFLAMTPQQRAAMGVSGRNYFRSNLTKQILISRYEDMFSSIINSHQVTQGKFECAHS